MDYSKKFIDEIIELGQDVLAFDAGLKLLSLFSKTEKEFAVRLTKEYGVATIPVSAFFQSKQENKVLRFCIAKKEETLERAVERLAGL